MKLSALGFSLVLFFAVAARGDVVLDQQHSFTSSVANSTNGNVSQIGETFTVGVAGTLHHIDVYMFRVGGIFDPTGDPLLRVYNTSGGLPTGAALATVTIPEANVPFNVAAFVSFDVSSAAISVGVGQVLAFSSPRRPGRGPIFCRPTRASRSSTPGAPRSPNSARIPGSSCRLRTITASRRTC